MINTKSNNSTIFLLALFLLFVGCNSQKEFSKKSNIKSSKSDVSFPDLKSKIEARQFESVIDGKSTKLYVLKNKNGLEATFTNFELRLVSLMVPDKNGIFEDIVLGFSNLKEYQTKKGPYFGATVGSY